MRDKSFYENAPNYYKYFFDLVETDNLLEELKKSKQLTQELLSRIAPDKENFSYEPLKWTTKEVIRHIIDSERVFAYRSFRFSRFDNTELQGFDENKYIENTKIIEQSLPELKNEYLAVRDSTIELFKPMANEMLDFKGKANNSIITARALGFMTVGHNLHHCNFIKAKYLNEK